MKTPPAVATLNATKLLPPKQRQKLLDRAALSRQAQHHAWRRLLLVSAPAGYGKTTTLIQLHDQLRAKRRNVAWLSLDRDDNDVVRFLAHFVDAIARAGLTFRPRPEGLLGMETGAQHGIGSAPSAATLKVELLNELSFLGEEIYVFLDDFHLVRDPGVIDIVGSILLAALDHVHLVIAAREVPDLPIARLRALDEVHEIDAGALAFSVEETQALAQSSGAGTLSPAQVSRLRERTEGWPASLQLALIALRNGADPEAFLQGFGGADRSIADFLVEEVLKIQPPEVQSFLLATSLLARFNTGLSNAVLDRRDAREMIDHLESHNLFVFSLDRDRNWYRYHHLFGELLAKRIRETLPDEVATIHARASAWLEANGHPIEAIDHAFALGDLPRAGELIDNASTELFASAQTVLLSALAGRLPPAIRRSLPRLQLEVAWENIIRWRFEEARGELDEVRRQIEGPELQGLPDTEIASLRMKLAHRDVMMDVFTDRLESAAKTARAWIAEHGTRQGFMSASTAVALLMCRQEAFGTGPIRAEWESLRARFLEARAVYGTVFLDTVVGSSLLVAGEPRVAEQALRQGLAGAVRMHGEGSNFAAMPGCVLAQAQYELNEPGAASELLDSFREVPPAFGLTTSLIARYTVLCRLAALDSDARKAHQVLDVASQTADEHRLPRLHAGVAYERTRLLIAAGQMRDAERLADDPRYREGFAPIPPGAAVDTVRVHYALAQILLRLERSDIASAIAQIRRWQHLLRDRQAVRYTIALNLLLARAQYRSGDSLAARRSLIEALRQAAPGGYLRCFLDEGDEIKVLLQDVAQSEPGPSVCSSDHLATLLAAFGVDPRPVTRAAVEQVVDPESGAALTAREIDILRLTAAHLVAREVAERLGMAETTVKWYWRRIFAKLGVNRRAIAVRVARQRGLIS